MASSVVVPVDFSEGTEAVLAEAAKLAKALGAKVWLLHVAVAEPDFVGFEVGPVYIRDSVAEELREAHQKIQRHQEALREQGLDVTAMLLPGEAAEKIVAKARELKSDLIVLGSHGHGALYHLLMGSVCAAVLKDAPCPVVVVPAKTGREAAD